MAVNIKNIFFVITLIFSNWGMAQNVNVKLLNNINNYKGDKIKVNYLIENPNSFPIYFVFNEKEFSEYGSPDDYYFDEDSQDYDRNRDEKIFNPRPIVIDIKTKDTLEIVPTLRITPDVEYLEECERKENVFFEKQKKSVIDFQNKNFQNENLVWNKRAKYINENIVILEPNEKRNFSTEINFTELLNNIENCNLSNIGFRFNKGEYLFSIKIHNDSILILQYLTQENKGKIERSKAKLLQKDFYSNTVILNIQNP